MKKYLYVFRGTDQTFGHQSPEEMQAHMQRWGEWMQKVQAEGFPLQDAGKVVGKDGRVVTDGPFAEGKELVGGFYIVTAKDYDAAVEIAQDFPDYDLGSVVEIREVMVFDQ